MSKVSYSFEDSIAQITMDDGKVNVMSLAMIDEINLALDQAEADNAIVILQGRPGIFSAGFDMRVLSQDESEGAVRTLIRAGAELALRVLDFPQPVVAACTGHAYPMGAFLLMVADQRVGIHGDYQLGMNEVAIGLTVPAFALELARSRMPIPYFRRTALNAEMFGPETAIDAGLLDRVVDAPDLEATAQQIAQSMLKLDLESYRGTKQKALADTRRAIKEAIVAELED